VPRPAHPDRRTRILQAAREEFGARGFDGARVARIARRAGVNKQLIFYYFDTKAGLYDAVTALAAAQLSIQDTQSGPATETVRRAIDTMLTALRARPELVASFVHAGSRREAVAPGQVLLDLERNLASVISKGQGLGYFRDDADPHVVARQGVVLCVGFLAVEHRFTDPDLQAWGREVGETMVRRLAW